MVVVDAVVNNCSLSVLKISMVGAIYVFLILLYSFLLCF
jgi:hypothetical protein